MACSWQGTPVLRICPFLHRQKHTCLKCTGGTLCQLHRLLVAPETLRWFLEESHLSHVLNGTYLGNPMGLKKKNWASNIFPPCFPFYIVWNLRSCFPHTVIIIIVSHKCCAYSRFRDDKFWWSPQSLQTITTGFWPIYSETDIFFAYPKVHNIKISYFTTQGNKLFWRFQKALYLECEVIDIYII